MGAAQGRACEGQCGLFEGIGAGRECVWPCEHGEKPSAEAWHPAPHDRSSERPSPSVRQLAHLRRAFDMDLSQSDLGAVSHPVTSAPDRPWWGRAVQGVRGVVNENAWGSQPHFVSAL